MNQAQVTLSVRHPSPEVGVIDVRGDLTAFAEDALMDAYNEATQTGARNIVLNFEGLEYMNSSGIGLLVTLLIRINRQKQKLLTCGLSEHYVHIFQLTRLNEAIGMFETESAALAASTA
jgi:anti-sigma B factor antagonist